MEPIYRLTHPANHLLKVLVEKDLVTYHLKQLDVMSPILNVPRYLRFW